MPILNLQRRARELGRIRIGRKGSKGQPEKLDRFRLTSPSRPLIERVAGLYGGQPTEWTPQGGAPQWEVVTDVSRLPILVPPQPVSQFLETWAASGCQHRCDGETNYLTGEPCDLEDKAHIDARPTTRLKVVLRDVEGIGVWRLESHGWNAAVELPDVAEFLAHAGAYVSGWVGLEERSSVSDGTTRRYLVPTIDIDVSPAALLTAGPSVDTATGEIQQPSRAVLDAGPGPADRVVAGEASSAPDGGQPPGDGPGPVTDADPDIVWQQIMVQAGRLGMTTPDLEQHFNQWAGVPSDAAGARQMLPYLQHLESQQ